MNNRSNPHPGPMMIAPKPHLAMAAPAKPPTSACDELVGNASSQVMMFQMIAPIRPPKTT